MASPGPDPAAELEARRRLSATELNRRLLELLTPRQREHSSVSLSRNAREIVQIEVTVKAGTEGIETVEDAELMARQIFDRLELAYPKTGGGGT